MSMTRKRDRIRFWSLLAIALAASALVGATVDLEENWIKVRSTPRQERQRLTNNLQKFDLLYTPDQQQAIRDLDRRINELDAAGRTQYRATLRRYHNWMNQLSETKQGELKQKAPNERMAMVKRLLGSDPVIGTSNARFLQFIDVGDHSPMELASIYHAWKDLSPSERKQVETIGPGARHQNLIKRAERKKARTDSKSPEINEDKWVADFKSWLLAHRKPLLNMLETEPGGAEILRRQAINYHYLETKKDIKAVAPEHLVQFLASLPPWLQSNFDHYPPEEASRRLTVVYRLIFPAPMEIKVGQAAAAASGSVRARPTPDRSSSPAAKTPAKQGDSPF
jgi:hypothetical protein